MRRFSYFLSLIIMRFTNMIFILKKFFSSINFIFLSIKDLFRFFCGDPQSRYSRAVDNTWVTALVTSASVTSPSALMDSSPMTNTDRAFA